MSGITAPRTIAFQSASIGTTAQTLLQLGFTAAQIAEADFCVIGVEDQPARVQVSGAAASGTTGLLVEKGDVLTIVGNRDIANVSIIRASSASANPIIQVFLQAY